MSAPIRVVCVDDNELVREAMQRKLCEPEFCFTGSLASIEGLVEHVEQQRAELVVLDIDIPGRDTAAALRELKRRHPEVRVAAFSGLLDDETIDRALESGADAYISKSEDSKTIVESVRRLAAGEFVLSPDVRAVYEGPVDPRPAATT